MRQYANSWRTGPDHHDEWDSTSGIIELNANLGEYAGDRICCVHALSPQYME